MGLRTFTFGGTSSSAYSMFITEAATYNVPERTVDMLSIPGRNGAYALDLGRFENVEVTYHVVVHKDTNANFQTELSDVRNWLASKVGYQRLTDDYNSNVYRMAIFKGGLETSETFVNGAEFDIVFECKPQRWLTSGETAVTVANGGTLSNPTPFDAEPLLAVDGYGTIGFNGFEIEIENVPIGDITLYNGSTTYVSVITLDETNINVGDTISIKAVKQYLTIRDNVQNNYGYLRNISNTVSDSNSSASTVYVGENKLNTTSSRFNFDTTFEGFDIIAGTSSDVINTVSGTIYAKDQRQSKNVTITFSCDQKIAYNASTHKITMSIYNNTATTNQTWAVCIVGSSGFNMGDIIGHSTKSAISDTVYIDCDIGECYTYNSADELVSLNGVISLGSDLPKLSSGTNTFTYDNTVTELKVTPRWWKV